MAEASEQSNGTLTFLSKMNQFRLEGKFYDIQLQVGGEVFKCLRSVLAANSEYFYTLLTDEKFEESNTPRDQPIALEITDASTFEEMLNFMYTGEIWVHDSNILELLSMNDFLKLCTGHVKEQCLEHVKRRSQADEPMIDALDLLASARLEEDDVLVDILHAHICRFLYYYSKEELLTEISFEKLNALLEFSKNYVVPIRGSADVPLKIVRTWIDDDRAGRSQYRSELMKNIDFANISSDFAASLVNMLQNAVDEVVVSLSKDVEPPSKLKMLALGIDTNLAGTADEFDGIISFNFKNVSRMEVGESTKYSSSCIIFGLSWKIGIHRRSDGCLGIYLCCDGTELSAVWNCYARATFTIVSPKERGDDFARTLRFSLFTSNMKSSGWGSRIKWDDLMDSANGYLNDDGSITLTVNVYADVPFLEK